MFAAVVLAMFGIVVIASHGGFLAVQVAVFEILNVLFGG